MRMLAGGGRAPREKLTLANGIPVTVALHYLQGQRVTSRIPGAPDQVMFTFTDGRVGYLPLEVADMIGELRLAPREPFTICKYGPSSWEVTRANEQANEPAPRQAAPPPEPPAPVHGNAAPSAAPSTQLEHALKTAIQAASNAEKYGQGIGYTVHFDADAIKCMAISVLIGLQKGEGR